jgi:hypothetical protein
MIPPISAWSIVSGHRPRISLKARHHTSSEPYSSAAPDAPRSRSQRRLAGPWTSSRVDPSRGPPAVELGRAVAIGHSPPRYFHPRSRALRAEPITPARSGAPAASRPLARDAAHRDAMAERCASAGASPPAHDNARPAARAPRRRQPGGPAARSCWATRSWLELPRPLALCDRPPSPAPHHWHVP